MMTLNASDSMALSRAVAFPRTIALAFCIGALLLTLLCTSCQSSNEPNVEAASTDDERLSGGAMTVSDATSKAFGLPAPNLAGARLQLHTDGDAAFEAVFVTAPAPVNAGLGPLFNNNSCGSCHKGDGRGRPPVAGEQFNSMLFRISVPGVASDGGPNPVAGFGGQVQTRAIFGTQPEMDITIEYTERAGRFGDGEQYSLQSPQYRVSQPYAPVPQDVMLSPRVAPPVFGLGLLEAVSEQTILALADEMDANGDGISGKANIVWDAQTGRSTLGRFGWKANQPNLTQQNAAAYNGDMGITSPLFPEENSAGQPQAIPAHAPEISSAILNAATHYTRTLGVPARRNVNDAAVKRGKTLFVQANCSGCHVSTLKTGVLADVPEASNQTIHPYTDLLLHDMGEDLSDNRPDFKATGREWRTAPLWGLGLTEIVNGHSNFLHDGRARNLVEAILWHGGEAERSKQAFIGMTKADREAVIKFLQSL